MRPLFEQLLSIASDKLNENEKTFIDELSVSNIKNNKECLQNILETISHYMDSIQNWLLSCKPAELRERPQHRITIIVNKLGDTKPKYVLQLIDHYQLLSNGDAFEFCYNQRPNQLTNHLNLIIQSQGIKAFLPYLYQVTKFFNEFYQKQLLPNFPPKLYLES